jgi:hypothetical protein
MVSFDFAGGSLSRSTCFAQDDKQKRGAEAPLVK